MSQQETQQEKLNPQRIVLDYFFHEPVSNEDLIKTTAEVTLLKRTYMRHNIPDMESNVVLKDSVDFIKEALAQVYDLEGVNIVVDQLSVIINDDTVQGVSYVITKEDDTITLYPFLHSGNREAIITHHKDAIEENENEIKKAEYSEEVRELLRDILAHEYALALIDTQE